MAARASLFVLLGLSIFLSCKPSGAGPGAPTPTVEAEAYALDPHSFSRPHEVRVTHAGFRWAIDFDRQVVEGVTTLRIDRHRADAPLVLDTRDLEIDSILVGRLKGDTESLLHLQDQRFSRTAWSLGESDPILGTGLRVELPPGVDLVRIVHRTRPSASGLQWLEPQQTADGTDPFLYSQSQAIHARSWFPCQDSPGVRFTYDAEISVGSELVALMAAEQVENAKGRYSFRMPQPVPAYLVALAVGRLEFRPLGERSGVWAEPSVVEQAASEFADVERMMSVAESIYGPYRWGRYDILVLPPAFPFGGMENPRLTFATPTILAGDRSLVALIAHELAHSWSGNLVTNATWEHLWLNEGFTVYIERRIMEALYGKDRAEMEAMLGRQDLVEELEAMDDPDERLEVELEGRDPDTALTDVAYEKGALFLRALEEAYGRETFDPILQQWFEANAFGSVTTQTFERFLDDRLSSVEPLTGRKRPDTRQWVHGPGVPEDAPTPKSEAFANVERQLRGFASGELPLESLDTEGWTPHEWLHFLRSLPPDLPGGSLRGLDERYGLTRSGNAEILAEWLEIGVERGYRAVDARLERFLLQVGRRKFLMPLYGALLDAGRESDARRIYAEARAGYHPITRHSVDALLAR